MADSADGSRDGSNERLAGHIYLINIGTTGTTIEVSSIISQVADTAHTCNGEGLNEVSVQIIFAELTGSIPIAGVNIVTIRSNTLLTGFGSIEAGQEVPSVAGGVARNRSRHRAVVHAGQHGLSGSAFHSAAGCSSTRFHSRHLSDRILHRFVGVSSSSDKFNTRTPCQSTIAVVCNGDGGELSIEAIGGGHFDRTSIGDIKLRSCQAEVDGSISAESVERGGSTIEAVSFNRHAVGKN